MARAGGASELFVDGEHAIAYKPGDAAALARQMQRLAYDEELRRRLGKQGRATAERLGHGKRLARELLGVYGDVSGRSLATSGDIPRLVNATKKPVRPVFSSD